ncbi:GRF1-interacting factor 2 [Platanthera zijinensis]|uniref:GRF1-interacting factor 2 n=1 Tax=Platanthera zijinensis TaxID=2320716 RepID=A0AAP0BW15_9ASPA
MRQPSLPMAQISPANVTTEQIQKYLDENKQLILAILDNQNLGKLAECAQPPQAGPSSSRPLLLVAASSGAELPLAPSSRRHLEQGSAYKREVGHRHRRLEQGLGLKERSATAIVASSKARPKREIGHHHRRQARVKGNEVSTRAGEALNLHVCMEAPLHRRVGEGCSPTG